MTNLSSSSDAFTSDWQQSDPAIHVTTFDLEFGREENQSRSGISRSHPGSPAENPDLNRLTQEILQAHYLVNLYDINQKWLTGAFRLASSAAVIGDFVSTDIRRWIPNEPSTTLTESRYLVSWIDHFSLLGLENLDKGELGWEVFYTYRLRIEVLRSDAELDGVTVNNESLRDFWSFIESVPLAGKAELVLVDNGNLRAVWDGEDGSHLGFQFLGDHMLQYVIFRRREGSGHVSRVAGRDTLEGVKKQVRNFDLEALLKI